jgi:hypothetical protein
MIVKNGTVTISEEEVLVSGFMFENGLPYGNGTTAALWALARLVEVLQKDIDTAERRHLFIESKRKRITIE